MLKPKTILALFEDGSDEAMKFALPYAADMLRKIIKENEDAAEEKYIQDEIEGKEIEDNSTRYIIDPATYLYHCEKCGATSLLPYKICKNCGREVYSTITHTNLQNENLEKLKEVAAAETPHIKCDELCASCLHSIDCFYVSCSNCAMHYTCSDQDEAIHYYCKCDDIPLGSECPHYKRS